MIQVWIIAKTSILENSRKQVFHVLCLLMLAIIAGSTLLSIFTEGVQIKILKDLCMTCILFGGGILSIALGSTGIPNDVENRTIHPILARPMSRMQYVAGKFIGTFLTVSLGVLAMSVVFAVLIASYQGAFDTFLMIAILFTLLEVAIIAAISTAISTFASPAITAALTFMIFLAGTIKIGYFGGLLERSTNAVSKTLFGILFHLLPNLECFNMKSSLVHHDIVPASYLIQVAIYAVCYTLFTLLLGSLYFSHKEV